MNNKELKCEPSKEINKIELMCQRGTGNKIIVAKYNDMFYLINLHIDGYNTSKYIDAFLKWGYFQELDEIDQTEEENIKSIILERINTKEKD